MVNDAVTVPVSTLYGNGVLETLLLQPNGWIYARVKMENDTWINFGIMRLEDFLANSENIKKA